MTVGGTGARPDSGDLDLIGELTDEHDRIRVLGQELTIAARADDLTQARQIAALIRDILRTHNAVEEGALFPALAEFYPDQIAALVEEHDDFDTLMATLADEDPGWSWPDTTCEIMARQVERNRTVQDKVFPAAVSTLRPSDWERIADVRHTVCAAPVDS